MTRALVERARPFRREPTRGEAVLWSWLRNRSAGPRFYRQKVMGPFIADFVCERPKLVVEIDGPVHARQRRADRDRETLLRDRGYPVLRLPAEQVVRDPGGAFHLIRATLGLPPRRPP